MTVNVPQLLTISDLMELLHIRKTTAYEVVKAKAFPKPIRIGSLRRWPADEVLEWLQGSAVVSSTAGRIYKVGPLSYAQGHAKNGVATGGHRTTSPDVRGPGGCHHTAHRDSPQLAK